MVLRAPWHRIYNTIDQYAARLNATSSPPGLRNYILNSEISTLKFLSKTKVPVPEVFDFNLDESNPISVCYILM
ncbi:hypothetical protein N7541_006526 [Penicillium brevicompactum]|uniref:Uncharacterized protein n=1 Tax=Penicillium brevicompactum TaxID=5074 RepID=A0A9W9R580_PENBR|nr:hypothetical protein N7541_006526 [Penicillium brevicompactum]